MIQISRRVAKVFSILFAIAAVGLAAPLLSSAQATAQVPGSPTGLSTSVSGTSITVTWSAPSSNGGSAITDYVLEYRDGGAGGFRTYFPTDPWISYVHTASTSTTATITGLTLLHDYEFRVAAVNTIGTGPWNNRILAIDVNSAGPATSKCSVFQDRSTYCRSAAVGLTTFDGRTAPTRVIEIAMGGFGECLLFEDGKIKCRSFYNDYGQIGDGTTTSTTTANWADVQGIDGSTSAKKAVKVAMGRNHVCALMDNGQVQCWGRNNNGQLGNSGTINSSVPAYVSSLTALAPSTTAVDIVSADDGTCVILDDATVTCWGTLPNATLGSMSYFDGSTDAKKALSFSGQPGPEGISTLGASDSYGFCVLTVSTQVVCWTTSYGNSFGGPRDSYNAPSPCPGCIPYDRPEAVSGVTGVTSIAQNSTAVCVLFTGGNISCWGDSSQGNLGNGNVPTQNEVVPVTGLDGLPPETTATAVFTSGEYSFCATREAGDTVCWGEFSGSGIEYAYVPTVIDQSPTATAQFGGGGGGTPPNIPAPPAAIAGDGEAEITVIANVGGVAPTKYIVFVVGLPAPGKSCQILDPAVSLSCVITGLTNGTTYTFKVQACAGMSCSPASQASAPVIPSGVVDTPPGKPRNLVIATRTAGTLGVTWAAPASPGSSSITGYTVAWREVGAAWVAGNTKSATALSASVTGLTAGKSYEFRVSATNATLTGAWSASTTGIVPVKAAAPQNVKGVANGMKITLTWSKVTTPSHSPVLNYSTYCAVGLETPARAKVGPTVTTVTLTITQHKLYVCRVAAVTAAGRGTDSAPIRVSIK